MWPKKRTVFTKENKEINYSHFLNDSKAICFIFSGAGYNYDKPLLHYSTMLMLENDYDVVHIHYSYGDAEQSLPLKDFVNLMIQDVNPVIDNVLTNGDYGETMFLGKSIGTIPIIAEIAKRDKYSHSKMILLTPLLKIDEFYGDLMESSNKAFVAIGDSDPHYMKEKIDSLEGKKNLKIKVISNANHALEVEPIRTAQSIKIIQEILDELNEFLCEEKE